MEKNICEILSSAKNICVVGISDKPDRDSGRIALFLQSKAYQLSGVHPIVKKVDTIPVYLSISEVPGQIDILDIFLNGDRLPSILEQILTVKPKCVWLQLGVHNDKFVAEVEKNNIPVIQDCCIAIEYRNCSNAGNLGN